MALPTRVLSLCAGAGGLDLGLRLTVPDARTVCYVENEVTACGVLVSRMEEKSLDPAPLWTDLRTFDGKPWSGAVDWVIGGYPCQPFSNAGRRLGANDPRHLWPEVRRIVSEVQPQYCFFENVGAHLRLGFYEVATDLQSMGYTVAATLLKASEVGAPHGRERLFILADSNHGSRSPQSREQYQARTQEPVSTGIGGYSNGSRQWPEGDYSQLTSRIDRSERPMEWPPGPKDDWSSIPERLWPTQVEPKVRGVADGMAGGLGRGDQLHILGNGVVPQQAAYALQILRKEMDEYSSSIR